MMKKHLISIFKLENCKEFKKYFSEYIYILFNNLQNLKMLIKFEN